jgi:tRNA-dihydrouridine synthase 2
MNRPINQSINRPIDEPMNTLTVFQVLQIGTANPSMAAEVAERMEQDIAGLDINMGCPKDYSVKGGMGAALLTKPDLIEEILRTVRSRFSKSLTCKIRLLPKLEDTLHLVKRIASTGVNAIAIHGRIKEVFD